MDHRPALTPLQFPNGCLPPASRIELALRWVPVVGWIAGAILQHARTVPVESAIRAQLSARPPMPSMDYWQSDAQSEIAAAIADCCVQACSWPHSHFIPSDPFEIMIEWHYGDGTEMDALFRIEKALSVKIDCDLLRTLTAMTFGEVVDLFEQLRKLERQS
jgi:hypothetical protein